MSESEDVAQVAHRGVEVALPVRDQLQLVVRRLAHAPRADLEDLRAGERREQG